MEKTGAQEFGGLSRLVPEGWDGSGSGAHSACGRVNMFVCWLFIVIFISSNKGTLKTKADILSGVNFISVALKHKQK